MIETRFGPIAQNGDYVLVVDFNYMKRKCDTYIARVYQGKAYTGVRVNNKYIHKLKAEVVIPESYVTPYRKRLILEDIAWHNDLSKGVVLNA